MISFAYLLVDNKDSDVYSLKDRKGTLSLSSPSIYGNK
jgi:hypothetical protein